jgi:hypothetical protein
VKEAKSYRFDDAGIKKIPPSNVISRRMQSVGIPTWVLGGEAHVKRHARQAIGRKYERDQLFSTKAVLERWFCFLYISLDGNTLKNILENEENRELWIGRLKGAKWDDERISVHTGAWITEKLCEEYLPEVELSQGALVKRIHNWMKSFPSGLPPRLPSVP